jgi:hypothetical protein
MSIKKLIDFFSTFSIFPVELNDVRDQIVEEYKVSDEIEFLTVDVDMAALRGLHYRYQKKDAVGKIATHSLIIVNKNLPIEEQRVVGCKEMIHILDEKMFRTSTPDAVALLASRLLTTPVAADFGAADLAVIKDQWAEYQALAVLFPEEARDELTTLYNAGKISLAEVSSRLVLPQDKVAFVMTTDWPKLLEALKSMD